MIYRGFLLFFRCFYANRVDSLRHYESALSDVSDYCLRARFLIVEGYSDPGVYSVHREIGDAIVVFQDRPYPVLARSGPATGNLEGNRLHGRLRGLNEKKGKKKADKKCAIGYDSSSHRGSFCPICAY